MNTDQQFAALSYSEEIKNLTRQLDEHYLEKLRQFAATTMSALSAAKAVSQLTVSYHHAIQVIGEGAEITAIKVAVEQVTQYQIPSEIAQHFATPSFPRNGMSLN